MLQVDPVNELTAVNLLLVLIFICFSYAPQLRSQSNIILRYIVASEDFIGFSNPRRSRSTGE